jgi:hypothetical protein
LGWIYPWHFIRVETSCFSGELSMILKSHVLYWKLPWHFSSPIGLDFQCRMHSGRVPLPLSQQGHIIFQKILELARSIPPFIPLPGIRGPAKVRNTVLKPAFHAGQNGQKATSAGPLFILGNPEPTNEPQKPSESPAGNKPVLEISPTSIFAVAEEQQLESTQSIGSRTLAQLNRDLLVANSPAEREFVSNLAQDLVLFRNISHARSQLLKIGRLRLQVLCELQNSEL